MNLLNSEQVLFSFHCTLQHLIFSVYLENGYQLQIKHLFPKTKQMQWT